MENLLKNLNFDLGNEYQHMLYYLHTSSTVKGLHRLELSEFLYEQAQSEMGHVREFTKMIIGLGGVPDLVSTLYYVADTMIPFTLTDPVEILKHALAMEQEVVSNYVLRRKQAEEVGGVDGTFVSLFLENQILDSRLDADEIKQMLGSV